MAYQVFTRLQYEYTLENSIWELLLEKDLWDNPSEIITQETITSNFIPKNDWLTQIT